MSYCDDMEKTTSQFLIYALHHPESDHVYIGQSSLGMKRPMQHGQAVSMEKLAHLPRIKWIGSLRAKGLEYEIAILEELPSADDLNDAEKFYIACFKAMGIPLLNLTEGGDGGAEISRRYWSDPKSREKKSKERLGQKHDEETKTKISESHKGKKKSLEVRANMSRAAQERAATPEWKEKQSKAQKIAHGTDEKRAQAAEWAKLASHDAHKTPEYRAKQSEAQKASCATEEVRARKSAATTRLAQDPEYIAKLSAARKAWWAARKKKEETPC
jgi:hypothetical protein